MGFQAKLGLFKPAFERKDFKYFFNLLQLETMEALLTVIRKYMQSTLKF